MMSTFTIADHRRPRFTTALPTLSRQEQAVLALMARGLSNAGISKSMCLSPKTVESHVSAVFVKLGLHAAREENRRVRAVLWWLARIAESH